MDGHRQRLGGWRNLMQEYGIPIPDQVNRQFFRRSGFGSGVGGGRQQGNASEYLSRIQSAYGGQWPAAPATTPPPTSTTGTGQTPPPQFQWPTGVQPFNQYQRASSGAGRQQQIAVPTTIGTTGVPNVIPRGARIYYPPRGGSSA